jgi:hypothetical protein
MTETGMGLFASRVPAPGLREVPACLWPPFRLAAATLVQLFDQSFLLIESIGSRGHGCKHAPDEAALLRIIMQMVHYTLLLANDRLRLRNKGFSKCKKLMTEIIRCNLLDPKMTNSSKPVSSALPKV